MLKEPLDMLLAVLADFEEHGTRDEKKSAIPALRRLSRKLEIQSLELHQQRLMLTAAESASDKEKLSDLNRYSTFPEIVEWSAEILNLKRQTRTLSYQTLQL